MAGTEYENMIRQAWIYDKNDNDATRRYMAVFDPQRLKKMYTNGPWPDANRYIRAFLFNSFLSSPGLWDSFTDKELEELAKMSYWEQGWSYDVSNALRREITRRETDRKVRTKGSLLQQVLDLGNERKYEDAARAIGEALRDPSTKAGVTEVIVHIYQKTKDDDLKVNLVSHASDELLDLMREASIPSNSMAITYCQDAYFDTRFDALLEKHFRAHMEPKNPAAGKTRDTTIKASIIRRADANQCLKVFKFYFAEQKEFSPKSVDAFIDKLDDPTSGAAWRKTLKAYLLSKEFHLRIKAITTDMLPLVMKLDDPEVTAKFNGSSYFRAKSIGKIDEYFASLPKADKDQFIDGVNDRVMLEKLLRALVERSVPLNSPVNEEFAIGTMDVSKTKALLEKFSLSTRTTTHLELFTLSLEHATMTELKEWILHNPLLVFGYNKSKDASKVSIRVDPVPDTEDDKIAKEFLDTWDNRTHSGFAGTVDRVYRVVTDRVPHHPSGNKKILWHGTNYFAAGCIIQGGFKVMSNAANGRLLGNGVYFADVASKVMQYISQIFGQGDSSGIVFVCEVDLGNMLTIQADGSNGHLTKTWMNHGYDSVYMPRGSPYGGKRLLNSEYCVHDPKRIKLLYAMDMSRKSGRR
jgi:hypothetical protein